MALIHLKSIIQEYDAFTFWYYAVSERFWYYAVSARAWYQQLFCGTNYPKKRISAGKYEVETPDIDAETSKSQLVVKHNLCQHLSLATEPSPLTQIPFPDKEEPKISKGVTSSAEI